MFLRRFSSLSVSLLNEENQEICQFHLLANVCFSTVVSAESRNELVSICKLASEEAKKHCYVEKKLKMFLAQLQP